MHLSGNAVFPWHFIIWSDSVIYTHKHTHNICVYVYISSFLMKGLDYQSRVINIISVWQVKWTFENISQIMLFPCLKSSSGFLSYLEEIPNSLFWLKKSCMSWPLAVSLTTFYTALHLSYYAVATLNLCLVPDQYRLLSLLSLLHCSSFWFSLVFWSLVLGFSSPLRGLASPSFLSHFSSYPSLSSWDLLLWYFSQWFYVSYSLH